MGYDARIQLGSFWNFFSIFEGRGHQQAIAEATDYSVICVLMSWPRSFSIYLLLTDLISESGGYSTIPVVSRRPLQV